MTRTKRTKAHQAYHTSDGKRVKSVTQIIGANLGWGSGALVGWARKEALAGNDPNELRDRAARIGTITHGLIEQLITGETFPLDEYAPADVEEARRGYSAFEKWWEANPGIEPVHSELQLTHEALRYGGTIDLVAQIDGALALVDFKTSKSIYGSHKIQAAAYERLYEYSYGPVNLVMILHLDKSTGLPHEHPMSYEELAYAWRAFQICMDLDSIAGKIGR